MREAQCVQLMNETISRSMGTVPNGPKRLKCHCILLLSLDIGTDGPQWSRFFSDRYEREPTTERGLQIGFVTQGQYERARTRYDQS